MASKFNYSTRLNPLAKNSNRVSLIGNNVMLTVVNGHRSFYNIDVMQLPFTSSILKSHKLVLEQSEHEYFNIGTRPEEPFDLQDTDLLHINYIMFLTAMRQAHARHAWLKTVPQYFTSYVREDILSSTYIHRLKLVTLQALIAGYNPRKDNKRIRELYVAQGFPAETVMLYLLYWISGEAALTIEGLLSVQEPFLLDYESMVEEANIIIAESNLESLAANEARMKLRFVANSNRYHLDDFAQELVSRSRLMYMHCRPFLGRQHAINYARSTISTYAMRIIHHYTDPSRSRLLTAEDGSHNNRFESIDEHYADKFSEDALIEYIDLKKNMLGEAFQLR